MESLLGKILSNRYRVDSLLGRGGMAEVYKAWDIERATFLAFKLLREDLAQDPVFLRRFKREAQTLSRLQHPNIVRFYGLEQDDLHAFILMDYVEGTTLQAEIVRAQGQGLSLARVLEVMRPVCSALNYAHLKGFVHCDVKPGNILIENTGRVLVTDFGIARLSEAATTTTLVGAGTPAYMAPEQVKGESPTPQTDIYALGIVLYEMLTGGERPFTGEQAQITGSTTEKVRWEHLNLTPPSPQHYNPDISPALVNVVMGCLQKDPKQRYASALEFFNELERAVLGGAGVAQSTGESAPSVTMTRLEAPPSPVDESPGEHMVSRRSPQITASDKAAPAREVGKPPQRWALAGLGMVLLVGLGVVMIAGMVGITWLRNIQNNKESRSAQLTATAVAMTTEIVIESHLQQSATPEPPHLETPTSTAKPVLTATHTPWNTPTPPPVKLAPKKISASDYDQTGSQDAAGNPVSFEPGNAIDGELTTAWRVKGDGRGQWLQINFGDIVIVNEVGIVPGYAKIDPLDQTDRFIQNYVVQSVRLEFSDGSQIEYSFDYEKVMQFIPVENVATTYIHIVILSTYEPRSSNPRYFTPISEVEVRGWQP